MIILDTSVEDVRWLASRRGGEAIVFLARDAAAPSLEAVVGAGAIDYFSQSEFDGNPAMLWLALRQSIRYHAISQQRRHLSQLIRERDSQVVRLTQKLWRSAPYDYRTGWFSHPQILERLNEEMNRSRRYRLHLTMVLTEFEGLAKIESHHGKGFADRVLAHLAERLRSVTRQTDVVGHYGMDSCLTLLTNTDAKGALRFCERISDVFSEPFNIDGRSTGLGWYSGVCQHDFSVGPNPEDLLKNLEDRVERAKKETTLGTVVAD
jgi:diguanylate cyclase (GGDEF)-like protein